MFSLSPSLQDILVKKQSDQRPAFDSVGRLFLVALQEAIKASGQRQLKRKFASYKIRTSSKKSCCIFLSMRFRQRSTYNMFVCLQPLKINTPLAFDIYEWTLWCCCMYVLWPSTIHFNSVGFHLRCDSSTHLFFSKIGRSLQRVVW